MSTAFIGLSLRLPSQLGKKAMMGLLHQAGSPPSGRASSIRLGSSIRPGLPPSEDLGCPQDLCKLLLEASPDPGTSARLLAVATQESGAWLSTIAYVICAWAFACRMMSSKSQWGCTKGFNA